MINADTLCFISEQTSYPEDYGKDFKYKVKKSKYDGNSIVEFKAPLQSFGVSNRNKREYVMDNIRQCIDNDPYIIDMRRRNCWQGEENHPEVMFTNQELTIKRLKSVDLSNTSHFIRRPIFEGNLLFADLITDNATKAGRNLACKIIDGGILPGFSARVFGRMERRGSKAVIIVKSLVTYDWVEYPSHPEAVAEINKPLNEAAAFTKDLMDTYCGRVIKFNDLCKMVSEESQETSWIMESFGLRMEDIVGTDGDNVVIKENNNVYIQPITDKFLRKKAHTMLNDWIHK